MDPVNALQLAGLAVSAAKGAFQVGQDLYILYKQAQNIDQTVQGLVTEVKSLGDACNLVGERLREIVDGQDSALPGKVRLWKCVELQIRDSRKTIDQLQLAFQDVREQSSGVLNQLWRQIKLNTKTKDIGEARNRIRSHTASLQMVLQTIAIEICYSAPRQTEEHLQTLLLKAEACVDHLKALRDVSTEQDVEQRAREAEIIAVGEETLSTAHQSLYGASVANRSVLGDPTYRSSNVHDWIRDVSAIERTTTGLLPIMEVDVHSTISDEPSLIFTEDRVEESTAPTSVVPNEHRGQMPEPDHALSDDEDDSDHELLVDAAKDALDTGRTAFHAGEYKEASDELQEALKIILELPTRQQSKVCNTWEIRYLLSVCAYHNDSLSDAKSQLWNVVDHASRLQSHTNEQLKQWCEAGHLLGLVCVKLGSLEEARQYCGSAQKAQTKLHGKGSPESNRSLALLARILHLQGQSQRSKVYSRLIVPESDRARYLKEFEDLGTIQPASQDRDTARLNALLATGEGSGTFGTVQTPSNTRKAPQGVDSRQLADFSVSTEHLSTQPPALPARKAVSDFFPGLDFNTEYHLIPGDSPTTPDLSKESPVTRSIHGDPAYLRGNKTLQTEHASAIPELNESRQVAVESERSSAMIGPVSAQTADAVRTATSVDVVNEKPGSIMSIRSSNTTETAHRDTDTLPAYRLSPTTEPVSLNGRRSQSTESTQLWTSRPHVVPEMRSISTGGTMMEDQIASRTVKHEMLRNNNERSFSIDDRASISSSRSCQEERLLSHIKNPAERRELVALLPQMYAIDDKIGHMSTRIGALEKQHQRSVPRKCIIELHNAERALALARQYMVSGLRPLTRPEVQKAEANIQTVERSLVEYEKAPQKDLAVFEDEDASPTPASGRRGRFSFRSSSKSENSSQDLLFETSQGDIRVRILDDSKPCKQFAARASEGAFVNNIVHVSAKGLIAYGTPYREGQAIIVTPPPTRITNEKDVILGYITEGFAQIREALDDKAKLLTIIDCRLAAKVRSP